MRKKKKTPHKKPSTILTEKQGHSRSKDGHSLSLLPVSHPGHLYLVVLGDLYPLWNLGCLAVLVGQEGTHCTHPGREHGKNTSAIGCRHLADPMDTHYECSTVVLQFLNLCCFTSGLGWLCLKEPQWGQHEAEWGAAAERTPASMGSFLSVLGPNWSSRTRKPRKSSSWWGGQRD